MLSHKVFTLAEIIDVLKSCADQWYRGLLSYLEESTGARPREVQSTLELIA